MKVYSIAIALVSLSFIACSSSRDVAGWEFLGDKSVSYSVERDVIRVGSRDGTFRSVKLVVRRAPINLRDMKIHFADGSVQDVVMRRSIAAGGESRVIDLVGRSRVITHVTFAYDTKNRARRRAVINLYGRH